MPLAIPIGRARCDDDSLVNNGFVMRKLRILLQQSNSMQPGPKAGGLWSMGILTERAGMASSAGRDQQGIVSRASLYKCR